MASFLSRSSVLLQECPTHEARSITALFVFSDRYEPIFSNVPRPYRVIRLPSMPGCHPSGEFIAYSKRAEDGCRRSFTRALRRRCQASAHIESPTTRGN